MADEIDIANDLNAFFLEAALKQQRGKPTEVPKGIGMCLSCETELEDDRRWCDKDCQDDYFREQKRNQLRQVSHDED